jgi:hypothetical protein
MPTLDAIIAAVFLWGVLSLFLWIMAQFALRWGFLATIVPLVVVTLIFLTAAILS